MPYFSTMQDLKSSSGRSSPLLIKAGSEGEGMLDPILPNMNFVRTRSADHDPQVYIPRIVPARGGAKLCGKAYPIR